MDRRGFLKNITPTILFTSLARLSIYANSDTDSLSLTTGRAVESPLAQHNQSVFEMTFENFVGHKGSAEARFGSMVVTSTPHVYSNPLIICGDNGLGKTHLLYAIAHAVNENRPDIKLKMVHAEDFHHELVLAFRVGDILSFRRNYQEQDFLLVDGLDFLKSKPTSQGELFSIISHMKDHKKQVVVASHKAPDHLEGFEQMLVSYLTSEGRTTLMTAPDQNARFKIILSKAQQMGVWIEDRHAKQIVEHSLSRNWNVRELEGALHLVITRSRYYDRPISSAYITETLDSAFA